MTQVVLIADPPVEGVACRQIVEETQLSPGDGEALYRAVLKDVFTALGNSSIDVLVNYPAPDDIPEDVESDMDPEAELRGIAGTVLDAEQLREWRFEIQVGSNFSAKAGNAITHLLRDEEQHSAAVFRPCVPRLERGVVDEAAIKLRRNEAVLGPTGDGDIYFAGFREPIDFEDVFEDNALEEAALRAGEEGLGVDFAQYREVLHSARAFRSVVSRLRAAVAAGNPVPEHLWEFIAERGISASGGELELGKRE